MGDNDEIRQIIHRESERILERALVETEGLAKRYDFQTEFAKSKKNRHPFVLVGTLLTIAALGGAAFGVTRIINERTRRAPIEVGAFEDLNLRDLLDRAKRNEVALGIAKVELGRLEEAYAGELSQIELQLRAAKDTLAASGGREGAEQRRTAGSMDAAAAKARDAAKATYEPAIASKKREIERLQAEVDRYDQRLAEQTKKQREAIDNQRRLFELETRQLTDRYEARIAQLERARKAEAEAAARQREELKAALDERRQRELAATILRYNPILDDERSKALLEGWAAGEAAMLPPLPSYLLRARTADESNYAAIERAERNFGYLSARLRAVPYVNSVPAALARAEAEALGAMASYRQLLERAARGLESRDTTIAALEARATTAEVALERYRWAVSEYTRLSREGGYILDPRTPADIVIALSDAFPVAEGMSAYVFRDGDRPIATIAFFLRDGVVRARLVELARGETIRPFDSILVQISGASPLTPLLSPASPNSVPSETSSGGAP